MALEYKKIEERASKYEAYLKALAWDIENTYSPDKYIGIDWFIDNMVGVYDEKYLIALGCISRYFDGNIKNVAANLSVIVRKDYRQKGISDELLKHLLNYCSELGIKKINAEILKNNVASINHIEKNNFDFVEEKDNILVYEKKLINKY